MLRAAVMNALRAIVSAIRTRRFNDDHNALDAYHGSLDALGPSDVAFDHLYTHVKQFSSTLAASCQYAPVFPLRVALPPYSDLYDPCHRQREPVS